MPEVFISRGGAHKESLKLICDTSRAAAVGLLALVLAVGAANLGGLSGALAIDELGVLLLHTLQKRRRKSDELTKRGRKSKISEGELP